MICSCTSDTPDPETGKGSEVSFDVKDLSRASVTTSFDNFAVYGDMKFSDNVPTVVFNKTAVVFKGGSWSYAGAQYWFPNHEHSFIAIHPRSVLEPENTPQYSDSKLTFTYSLPISEGNLVKNKEVADIITATHRRLYSESDGNTVTTFRFGHLLSLINFSLELNEASMKSDECFKIHKLEMSGFGTSANISIKPAPRQSSNQTDDSEIHILTNVSDGQLTIEFAEPIKVLNGATAIKMFDDNNAIILLPQTFATKEDVQIRLTYSVNDETEETQVSASLSSFTWESGKSYNYKIKLELEEAKEVNMIISNATIAPWNLIEDPNYVEAR